MSPMNKFFLWCAIIGICMVLGPVLLAHFMRDIIEWFRVFIDSFTDGSDPNLKN